MASQDKIKRKIEKILENKGDTGIAQLDVALETIDKLEDLKESIGESISKSLTNSESGISLEIEAEDIQDLFLKALEGDKKNNKELLEVLKEIRDKEVEKEDKTEETELLRTIARNTKGKDIVVPAPTVTVTPQPVEIDLNLVTDSVTDLHATAKEIKDILAIKEEFEPSKLYDEEGNPVDWEKIVKLLEEIRDKESKGGSGGYSSNLPLLEELKKPTLYATLIDDVTTAQVMYVGYAIPGSATSSAVWQIRKIDESGSPTTLALSFADGNQSFDNIWDNRASLSYS